MSLLRVPERRPGHGAQPSPAAHRPQAGPFCRTVRNVAPPRLRIGRRPIPFLSVALLALLLLSACRGNSADTADFPRVLSLGKGDLFPSILNHTLGVGANRLSIGLTDRDDNRVLDAQVQLRFYDLNGDEPVLKSEADAHFVGIRLAFVDESDAGATSFGGDDGVYVADATFDVPGDWGAQVTVTRDGHTLDPIPYRFSVLEDTPEPSVGDPAPAVRQLTLAAQPDITQIDSSSPPRPRMHDITVADALADRTPLVVAFATPAFCESRTCAPVMDTVMDPLFEKYAGRARFIHIEPHELRPMREDNVHIPVPAMLAWGLQTEPWVFVVGADGHIAAKFEGIVALDEVESALLATLNQP